MANETRRIGLSLGADICWPICYEKILERLDLAVKVGGTTVSFDVERVSIEPFDLRQKCRYELVIDRLTHWYSTSREWIKKSILLDDLYVFNNPWSIQSMEKQTSYCAMIRLGLPIPETWLVPPKEYESSPDLAPTLARYAKLFDLNDVGEHLGYPMFMKPYDGGGWVGVSRIDDESALRAAYEQSGRHVMHLQRAVEPHDRFIRCVGLGPQVRQIHYDPSAALHDRYQVDPPDISERERRLLEDITLTINTFFGWDFNSCELLRADDGTWVPIDFANPCPDSQVTSLHYHFPWLILANIRWSVFCAATKRSMRKNLDWKPYFEVAESNPDFLGRVQGYARIARERLQEDEFSEFCEDHLSNLSEVAWEFFGTDDAKDAVRQKVAVLFPEDEREEFTELFWDRIQLWRREESATDREPKP